LIAFDTEMITPEQQKRYFMLYCALKIAFMAFNWHNQKSAHFYGTRRDNPPTKPVTNLAKTTVKTSSGLGLCLFLVNLRKMQSY